MKRKFYVPVTGMALALVLSGTTSYSQNAAAPVQESDATQQSAAQQKTIQMAGAVATLNKTLDSKKARQGDPVTAKLQNDLKVPDATELPKNTVLVGHVDQVQASDKKSDGSIQVTFDKAQLKNGQEVPVKATIMKIAPPPNAMADQGAASAPSAMPSSPAPAASSGGTSGGSAGTAGSAPVPQPSAMPDSSSPPSPAPASDVAVKSDIHESNSGTFTAKGKNVHITDGTTLQLAIAVIPPNTKIQ